MRYIYLGDRLTSARFKNQPCDPVRNKAGKCIRGKNGSMLVTFASGERCNVLGRRLRLTGEARAIDQAEREEAAASLPKVTQQTAPEEGGDRMRPKAVYDGSTLQLPNGAGELEEIGGLTAPGNVERLVAAQSFVYAEERGSISLRLETKQRGDRYWVAYKRIGGRLRKTYVCEARQLDPYLLDSALSRLLTAE